MHTLSFDFMSLDLTFNQKDFVVFLLVRTFRRTVLWVNVDLKKENPVSKMKLSSLLSCSNRLFSDSSSIWIRNLVLDGDVEANPGPNVPLLDESHQMLSSLPSLPLTYSPTALGTTWLDSRTIDNYMLDLSSRHDYPGITYFPPDSVNDFFNELRVPEVDILMEHELTNGITIIPINDGIVHRQISAENSSHYQGSHWALLIFYIEDGTGYWYFADSLSSESCFSRAKKFVTKVVKHPIKNLRCAKQPNGYDCGVYVCKFTEIIILNYIVNQGHLQIFTVELLISTPIAEEEIKNFRALLELIDIARLPDSTVKEQRKATCNLIISGVVSLNELLPVQSDELTFYTALGTSWLVERTINNFLEMLTRNHDDMFFVRSDVLHCWLQPVIGSVENTWWLPLTNNTNDFIFFIPINDGYTKELDKAMGSHWTLLVFERCRGRLLYYYLDSYPEGSRHCKEALDFTLLKLSEKFSEQQQFPTSFIPVNCPKQNNMFDCGVYVCYFAELISNVWTARIFSESQVQGLDISMIFTSQDTFDPQLFRKHLEEVDLTFYVQERAEYRERREYFDSIFPEESPIQSKRIDSKKQHFTKPPSATPSKRELKKPVGRRQSPPKKKKKYVDSDEEYSEEFTEAVFPSITKRSIGSKQPQKKKRIVESDDESFESSETVVKSKSKQKSKKNVKKPAKRSTPPAETVFAPVVMSEPTDVLPQNFQLETFAAQNSDNLNEFTASPDPAKKKKLVFYDQFIKSIQGPGFQNTKNNQMSARKKRRALNFHLVEKKMREAEQLFVDSISERHDEVELISSTLSSSASNSSRKSRKSETTFAPRIDTDTPKIFSEKAQAGIDSKNANQRAKRKNPKASGKKSQKKVSKSQKRTPIKNNSKGGSCSIMAIDLETFTSLDNLNVQINDDFIKQRREQKLALRNMNTEESAAWVSSQKVFMLSVIYGQFKHDEFILEESFISSLFIENQEVQPPTYCQDVFSFTSEEELLNHFAVFLGEKKPSVITGFNSNNFDLSVLDNRFNHYDIVLPPLVPAVDADDNLSQFWMTVKTDYNGTSSCDSLIYAKRFIKSRRGFSLRCLVWYLLFEAKLRLHEVEELLPIDFVLNNPQNVINYCFQDSVLALKLFLLFQRNKVTIPTYVTRKTTLKQIVKYNGIELLLCYYAQLVQQLRMHTSMCLKLFIIHQVQNGLTLPKITEKDINHVQTLLKNASAEYHGIERDNRGLKPDMNADLASFVQHVYCEKLERLSMPLFPSIFSFRIMNRISETILINLEINLKMRYSQYIERFINCYFDKTSTEKQLSQAAQSAFRYRLRQVKNLFLELSREAFTNVCNNLDDDNTCLTIMTQLNEDLDEKVLEINNLRKRGQITQQDVEFIANKTEPLIDQLLTSEWPGILFPTELVENDEAQDFKVELLLDAVDKKPQSFITAAIEINNFLEEREYATFSVIPLIRTNIPGFFEIDTQALWQLLRSTLTTQDVNEKKRENQWNTITEVSRFTPSEQNQYWQLFFNFNRAFKKSNYKFNNNIKTDGFSVCIEMVREDYVGVQFKPDSSIFSEQDDYLEDLNNEDLATKNHVFIDPGKGDLLYFCSAKPNFHQHLAYNHRRNRYDQAYTWMRLTNNEWSRISRLHQKLRRRKRKSFILSNGLTVEQEEAKLSKDVSKSTMFNSFSNYIEQKIATNALTIDFYCLKIWRIQKMQRYVHIQKTEEKLLRRIIANYGPISDSIILLGDNGKKTSHLKRNAPTRNVGWKKFFKRHEFDLCLVNEHNTSSKCPCCRGDVAKFMEVPNPRPWKRVKKPVVTLNALLKCCSNECKLENRNRARVWNRNKLACLNFEVIVESFVGGHERPQYLC
ncbi:hypothetical protein RCL1_003749 [Eukaryota sp. TZLM3-RCL]